MSLKTRTLKIKIVVDENTIEDKYPNYELNYSDTEEFMDMIQYNKLKIEIKMHLLVFLKIHNNNKIKKYKILK